MRNFIHFVLLLFVFHVDAIEHYSYVSEEVWQQIGPYLMPDNHPLKRKLDKMFSKVRILKDQDSLVNAGFERKKPEPQSQVTVTRHKSMSGYIFKLYYDSQLKYYHKEPEYIIWMLRARGAKFVRQVISEQKWQRIFKAPRKWIYPLPPKPAADPDHLQKNFILVEEEMDILRRRVLQKKWKDGKTITFDLLNKLFYLITRIGLSGGCKFDNIPLCKDGRMAFIDTQNNLKWPLPYDRLFNIMTPEQQAHWNQLVQTEATVPRIAL